MSVKLKMLPIVEHWDCHQCGICCRGSQVFLDEHDLQRLREQNWEEQPEYRGTRVVVRDGLLGRYRLAQRDDGRCVFLTEEGLCRIHKELGEEAKPLFCRWFPLQVVPIDGEFYLTMRRCCPSAAAEKGRPLAEHRQVVAKLIEARGLDASAGPPPEILPGTRRNWKDTLCVAGAIERLLTDSRYPLVRRLVHGLQFCDLLAQCRLKKVDSTQLAELVEMLAGASEEGASQLFRDRPAPSRAAGTLLRQAAAEYARLHPTYIARGGWRERWRIFWAAFSVARGRGDVPALNPAFAATTFEELEQPLGRLAADVYRPLDLYFESLVISKQYALVGRLGWSLVESFRALALSHPVGMWLLHYACGDRAPTNNDAFHIITALDRGQGYSPLLGRTHKSRLRTLAKLGQLPHLVAWYSR